MEHKASPATAGDDIIELASVTTGADYWTTQSNLAHGVGVVRMADGPHGLRVQDDDNPDHLGLGRSRPATCFPPAVTLASSWDVDLVEEVGMALGREARACGVSVVLGPGLNLKRSPLCGRNFEYYSEDPLLGGRLAGAMVRGIQSNKVGACLKHFAVNNQEADRMRVSAEVDDRTLREVYLRTFEIAVREGRPWAIMSAYNRINGVPASENPWLLTDVLRNEWGFDGVVMSDWGAVRDPVAALAAGLDLRMPGVPGDTRVKDALRAGGLESRHVERAAANLRLLSERTYAGTETVTVDTDAHHELTRRAAAEAAVLLHNDASLLPLQIGENRAVAVIGELARTSRFQGAGSSAVNPTRTVTALDAVTARLGSSTVFEAGYAMDGTADRLLVERAVEAARNSDIVLLFLGLPPVAEAEGSDRSSIDLPADQVALIDAVADVNPNIVVALSNGSIVTTAKWRARVGAIVEFWLSGQSHGDAVVDVLTGAVNPSGKLPETVPLRIEDTPAFLEFPGALGHVRYGEGLYVGYRWYDARDMAVDFPFGHGLSYTQFAYSELQVETFARDDPRAVRLSFKILNTGDRAGAEVVQLYVDTLDAALPGPGRQLRAFRKVRLTPGEERLVELAVSRAELEYFHADAGWVFEGGRLSLHVGSSSRDIRLEADLEVPGNKVARPLTIWSPLGDWLDHPAAGRILMDLIDSRGGMKGRLADLIGDPTGQDSARGFPLVTVTQFPGVPLSEEDVESILHVLDDI